MNHRVGVVVRTKDRPYFLARALSDIAAQTFGDAEVLVVNDHGDLDRARSIVASSPIASRTRVIDVADPGGRCLAANTGIRATDAEYVVLHDDDDLWHPEFLERTVGHLDAHADEGGVGVATEIVYEKAVGAGWAEERREPFWQGMVSLTFLDLLRINRAVPISFLYRRGAHEVVGYYDEGLDAVEDWEFYLRLAERFPLGFLPEQVLAFWTQRPTASGVDGNSMFELHAEHRRDDIAVRDAALRDWVARNGAGLPLYIAHVESRLREEFGRELREQLDRQRQDIVAEIFDRHPLWRRARRLRGLISPWRRR